MGGLPRIANVCRGEENTRNRNSRTVVKEGKRKKCIPRRGRSRGNGQTPLSGRFGGAYTQSIKIHVSVCMMAVPVTRTRVCLSVVFVRVDASGPNGVSGKGWEDWTC